MVLLAFGLALGGPEARGASSPATGEGGQGRRYAIVVEKRTVEGAGWKSVVDALQKKHSATIFHREAGDGKAVRQKLAAFRPHYVCFVARPDELAREGKARVRGRGRVVEMPLCGLYYHGVSTLMRSLDGDPYDDARWAVLTGATPQDALRVVSAKPLVVRRGLSHVTSGWLTWMERGVSFSEVKKGRKWVKEPGKPPEEVQGPDDTTKQFVDELNSGNVDMVSSSGHATEADWDMGYSYRSGKIVRPSHIARLPQAARDNYKKLLEAALRRAQGGMSLPNAATPRPRLLAVDTANQVYAILSDNPKIYYSPGNCRIARVDADDCLALSWIHHGAMQFSGHVGLQMRSCYAWGVAEYFLALQGRFTFAEAVWLNQQALRWAVSQMSEEDKKGKYICCRGTTCYPAHGKLYWQTTVLYGDPAWEARAKPVVDPLYDQQMRSRRLKDGRAELTFTVKMRRASRPSRPAAFFLAIPAGSHAEVKEGPADLVIADDFALVPFWKAGEPAPEAGKEYRAVAVVRRPTSPAPQEATPLTE